MSQKLLVQFFLLFFFMETSFASSSCEETSSRILSSKTSFYSDLKITFMQRFKSMDNDGLLREADQWHDDSLRIHGQIPGLGKPNKTLNAIIAEATKGEYKKSKELVLHGILSRARESLIHDFMTKMDLPPEEVHSSLIEGGITRKELFLVDNYLYPYVLLSELRRRLSDGRLTITSP